MLMNTLNAHDDASRTLGEYVGRKFLYYAAD